MTATRAPVGNPSSVVPPFTVVVLVVVEEVVALMEVVGSESLILAESEVTERVTLSPAAVIAFCNCWVAFADDSILPLIDSPSSVARRLMPY